MKLNSRFEILTPNGFKEFEGINTVETAACKITTTSKSLTTSLNHLFVCGGTSKRASSLKPGDLLIEGQHVVKVELVGYTKLYDPVNVGNDHIYCAGGFVHHNCTFEGSSYTLVDGAKLASLPLAIPIYDKDNLEVFQSPQKDRTYVITVDVSRGRHMDFSAFSVVDVTSMPYNVVATYKDNTVSTLEFPHLIYNTARQFNDAFILIEINDLGEEVSNTIWHDYEYENVYFTSGNELSQVRGYPGVRTTSKVKSLGCSVLKELVEKDQLILNSHRIIEELGLFVIHRKSYASSDPAVNDDLCTTMWLLAWLTKQDVFQQVTNINLRNILTEKKQEYIDSTMTPFGFYHDGRTEDHVSKVEDNKKLPNKLNPYYLTEDQVELLKF